mgnify:CR=1 FL=1
MPSNVRVLLVDDNPMILEMLRQSLSKVASVSTTARKTVIFCRLRASAWPRWLASEVYWASFRTRKIRMSRSDRTVSSAWAP